MQKKIKAPPGPGKFAARGYFWRPNHVCTHSSYLSTSFIGSQNEYIHSSLCKSYAEQLSGF